MRTQDYVAHAPASLEPTPLDSEAWTRFLAGFDEAFPDLHLTVEDAVGEGDLVAQRVHFAGTHTGEFQGGWAVTLRMTGLMPAPSPPPIP